MTTKSTKKPTILIIGGGFSGAMVATNLLRLNAALEIILVDECGSTGRGVAYLGNSPHHLLNVPAASMSAFAQDPNHFLRWAQARDPNIGAADFLPRGLYGLYLEQTLADAIASNSLSEFRALRDQAVDLEHSESYRSPRVKVLLKSGRSLDANVVVLALGNFPPRSLPGATDQLVSHPGYCDNPWRINLNSSLSAFNSITVVGTGLSAVDIIVEALSCGYKGTITAISTLGLIPQPHRPGLPKHAQSPPVTSRCALREAVRLIRTLARAKLESQAAWQEIMDDLRPHVQQLWKSLSDRDRSAFMRHLRPYWDVHRHRIAPQIAVLIDQAIQNGQLVILRAKVLELSANADQIKITYKLRSDSSVQVMHSDCVVNCTGPHIDITKIESKLLQSLLRRGYAMTDNLGIGLKCTTRGNLIRSNGTVMDNLFTLGATRRGELWETIAVRELRDQAADVAMAAMNVLDESQADNKPKVANS